MSHVVKEAWSMFFCLAGKFFCKDSWLFTWNFHGLFDRWNSLQVKTNRSLLFSSPVYFSAIILTTGFVSLRGWYVFLPQIFLFSMEYSVTLSTVARILAVLMAWQQQIPLPSSSITTLRKMYVSSVVCLLHLSHCRFPSYGCLFFKALEMRDSCRSWSLSLGCVATSCWLLCTHAVTRLHQIFCACPLVHSGC